MTKQGFVQPRPLSERLPQGSRSLSYPESAANNMPMQRFVKETKHGSSSGGAIASSMQPTERSAAAPAGTTKSVEG